METFWFFRLQFYQACDSTYDSDFQFSLGHKHSYDSNFDSDSIASENQPLDIFLLHYIHCDLKILASVTINAVTVITNFFIIVKLQKNLYNFYWSKK